MSFQAIHLATAYFAAAGEVAWYNVPGFELWRFVNLGIFSVLLYYILRRPLSEAFKSRREGIRRELTRAKEERDAALAKLAQVEERLSHLDVEVERIQAQARQEATEEKGRITVSTEDEIKRLREQARREIETAGKTARFELRQFAAEKSVQMAEEMLRREVKPADDARLIKDYVEELGGIRR